MCSYSTANALWVMYAVAHLVETAPRHRSLHPIIHPVMSIRTHGSLYPDAWMHLSLGSNCIMHFSEFFAQYCIPLSKVLLSTAYSVLPTQYCIYLSEVLLSIAYISQRFYSVLRTSLSYYAVLRTSLWYYAVLRTSLRCYAVLRTSLRYYAVLST